MHAYSGENYNWENTQTTGSPFSHSPIGEGQQEKINNSKKKVSVDIKVNVRRMGQAAEKVIIYIKYHL